MTKRITTFLALLVALCTVALHSASAQNKNKVLFEEFTSSTCPPCGALEPFMHQALIDKHDEVVVLRWHQNFPQTGDPSYVAYTDGQNRCLTYYGVQGIPAFVMNGGTQYNPGSFAAQPIEDSIDADLAAMQNYYTMSVTQNIVGDSVIALVTVTTGATVPTATDLRICGVVGERFIQYEGCNGVSAHEYVVRATIPALMSTGSLPVSAAFNQAANTTQTYRFASVIKSTWNASNLLMVSFIQSAGSKKVYQSSWTENLNIDIEPVNNDGFYADGSSTDDFMISNNSSTAANLVLSLSSQPTVTPIVLGLKGSSLGAGNTVTVPANGAVQVSVTGTYTDKATGSGLFGLIARTADSIGAGGHPGMVIGKDVNTLILDGGSGGEASTWQGSGQAIQKSLSNLGIPAAYSMGGVISPDYTNAFNNDWSHFKNVVYTCGYFYAGLYTNDGSLDNVAQFLQGGGNLIFEDGVFSYIYEENGLSNDVESLFHCDTANAFASSSWKKVIGLSNPVSSGISTTVANEPFTSSLVTYDDSCHALFVDEYDDTTGVYTLSQQNGKAVYLTFTLGQVTAAKRDSVIGRIFGWFNGALSTPEAQKASNVSFTASPNPFSSSTNIQYVAGMNESGVQMSVIDILGREVAKLTPNRAGEGTYTATLTGANLATGSYHVVVRSSEGMHTIPVMITR